MPKVSIWSEPIYEAFIAGCWHLVWTSETLYWVAKPELRTETVGRRQVLHSADGPAINCDSFDTYVWHGTIVPDNWIADPESLTPQMALTWPQIEERRAACEILGWDKILAALDARVIDEDGDPEIGQLVEVSLPDSGPERFLRVRCGTGRMFALPVPRAMQTALEAQSWTWGLNPSSFSTPEVRT